MKPDEWVVEDKVDVPDTSIIPDTGEDLSLRPFKKPVWLNFSFVFGAISVLACFLSSWFAEKILADANIVVDMSNDASILFSIYAISVLVGVLRVLGILGIFVNLVSIFIRTKLQGVYNSVILALSLVLVFLFLSIGK